MGQGKPNDRDNLDFEPTEWASEKILYTAINFSDKDGDQSGGVLLPGPISGFQPGQSLDPNKENDREIIDRASRAYSQIERAKQSLDFDKIREHAQLLKERGRLLHATALIIIPYLFRVYVHKIEGVEKEEALDLSLPHFKKEKEDTVRIDLKETDFEKGISCVESFLKILFREAEKEKEFSLYEDAAEWIWTHLIAWALETMEEEVDEDSLAAMSDEEWQETFDAFLFEKNPEPFTDRSAYLLNIYIQNIARFVVDSVKFQEFSLEKLERLLGLRPKDTIPSVKSDLLSVFSPPHYQALREALATKDFNEIDGTPWPTALLEKGNAQGQAQLRPPSADSQTFMPPEEERAWVEIMRQQREELSDLDADVLDALSAIWLRQANNPKEDAVASINELLAMRGLKPKKRGEGRRGGYEPEQRTKILKALSHIQNLWLHMFTMDVYEETERGGRKKTRQTIQSRPFVITDRMGQMRLDGYLDVDRFIFRPGAVFARFLTGPGRQTALLSAKALGFDPYRQTIEKRLTRYLSWQWRTQAHGGNYLRPYRVSTLFDAAGRKTDSRRGNWLRERLEKALDILQSEGVIGAWQYDRWDEAVAENRGWFNVWQDATIVVEPPDAIKEHYLEISQHKKTKPKHATKAENLGRKIRNRRKEMGLTQLQLAEKVEISRSYLSQIERENYDKKPSPSLRNKLEAWLETSK